MAISYRLMANECLLQCNPKYFLSAPHWHTSNQHCQVVVTMKSSVLMLWINNMQQMHIIFIQIYHNFHLILQVASTIL